MEATSKENVDKTNSSEKIGVAAELITARKMPGGIAAPPVKIAAPMLLKFPASLMDKEKTLNFLLIAMIVMYSLSAYSGILHIGLHSVVSNTDAMDAEICPFFRVVVAVFELAGSVFTLVYQILKFKWNRD